MLAATNNNSSSDIVGIGGGSSPFDVLVVGAGSGGAAFAKRAAMHGARVAIVEGAAFGGTCVNVGCVPKKIMWWGSQVRDFIRDSHQYGFPLLCGKCGTCGSVDSAESWTKSRDVAVVNCDVDWKYLKARRDASVKRLNGIYEKGLQDQPNITVLRGHASFVEKDDEVWRMNVVLPESHKNESIEALQVVLAPGSSSTKVNLPGEQECTTGSDGFFSLEKKPENVCLIGAGYIAVEFAGMLQGLGVQVDILIREDRVLRKFDDMISLCATENLRKQGVNVITHASPASFSKAAIDRTADGIDTMYSVTLQDGRVLGPYERIIVAVGRHANIESLNLPSKMKLTEKGHIEVDEYQNTSCEGVFAIGDVTGVAELTPTAIAAGRALADRLFLVGKEDSKICYDNIPTVVFAHPPIGSIGLSERDAREMYETVLCYNSTAVNLYYNVFDLSVADKPKIHIKLVCSLNSSTGEECVRGIHVVGMGADEMMQGFGIAFNMGCTKKDIDNVIAIHPSAAEEVVTCHPWRLPHPENPIKRPLKTVFCVDEDDVDEDMIGREGNTTAASTTQN